MSLAAHPHSASHPVLRPLLSAETLAARTAELGLTIARDYRDHDLTLVGVLKGSFMWFADLSRAIYAGQRALGLDGGSVTCEFLSLQSYGDETTTSGVVQITADLTRPVEGRDVLIVEDIVDTGLTMSYLFDNLATRRPASIKLCALLHKPARTLKPVHIDYLGFTIDDLFVVGYGLDYAQRYPISPYSKRSSINTVHHRVVVVTLCLLHLFAMAKAQPPAKANGGAVKPKPKKPERVAPPPPSAYEVLFTFDDGPRLDTTPKVLDTLDQYGIKAVFFVNGVRFAGKGHERARELMRETVRRGHIIGNHTIHHYFLCGKRGPDIAEREITENAALITEAIGEPPKLFRTPYGSHCASLSATLQRLNIHPIGWNVDPQDWKLQDANRIYDFMVQALRTLRRPRSILLFHDVQPATVEMLPRLLKWIAEENKTRREQKQPEIKIIDYSYLLSTNPPGAAAPSLPG